MASYDRMMSGMGQKSTAGHRAAALTDAVLEIVADRGLDQVTVREVATAANVSIGTVQHYFPTKDAMLVAAFDEVVRRIRARIASVELGPDVRSNLSAVLRELLPLDDQRAGEVRVQLAFAAHAAHSPALADVQRTVLDEISDALAEAFAHAWGTDPPGARCRHAAQAALATADGLALHAVSSGARPRQPQLTAPLELLLDALMADGGHPTSS